MARPEQSVGEIRDAMAGVGYDCVDDVVVLDGRTLVALAVSLALLASCSIATVVTMLLPWLLQRLGTDPAFGSGPLATVVQALLSIIVYYAVAIPIAGT